MHLAHFKAARFLNILQRALVIAKPVYQASSFVINFTKKTQNVIVDLHENDRFDNWRILNRTTIFRTPISFETTTSSSYDIVNCKSYGL